mmetsp:Transcript_52891/g.84034  ORF Transcript_52891/g.84034 Transcript_52891/m.84034 type:complete len:844 (+) Transcript_52891:68-2599(+)|eukprot:CAMPEP_0169096520 /NCGR_PEP_ID=MMETSP1015-20121227/19039_1 /TAXON_ID=342587 /ORGANISM="Karlodinium micrum, Strain CCMP2283" /LENGTH=843 /DNA_ID=CAMNT_0009157283 /DNA_START=68 /DNA_END=2599 /DNA_ORIENTATION=-
MSKRRDQLDSEDLPPVLKQKNQQSIVASYSKESQNKQKQLTPPPNQFQLVSDLLPSEKTPQQQPKKAKKEPMESADIGRAPRPVDSPALTQKNLTAHQNQFQSRVPEKTHQQPLKKAKKETVERPDEVDTVSAPTPARNAPRVASQTIENSASKRPKRNASPTPQTPGTPSSHRGRNQDRTGIAWILSSVRSELEAIASVEGVRHQLEQFPECVLLGGITARRELVSALLGEHAHAGNAAAALIAPGMRQPIALELRGAPSGTGLDLASLKGPEADAWLASVTQAASAALGSRLKVDSLRLRLSAAGCANLDVVDLPERSAQALTEVAPKVEEMRVRHLGSETNLIVCLEPGLPLDLARRFDPSLQRTVLLGAAAVAAGGAHGITTALPPSMLCGPAAARALEERFTRMCLDRAPKWITGMEHLELRLGKAVKEAEDAAQKESMSELLCTARAVGLSFGRALQHVVGGTVCYGAGASTLEEELLEFAAAASQNSCGFGRFLSGQEAAEAADDLFKSFNGVEGYIVYLRENVGVSSAEVPLNGGSSWFRMMEEIEVAMRLVRPTEQDLQDLASCAIQAGGTGVHGHQRWDDVVAKLLLEIAFEPLRRRIRYIAARVAWALQQQKGAVAQWMESVEDGPGSRLYSPLFAQHLQVLRSSPITRDLVFGAFDKATENVAETLLGNLEGTLSAMCLNPKMMLRPATMPEEDNDKMKSRAKSYTRDRVKAEMRRRSGSSGGCVPVGLRDCTFEPNDAARNLPAVGNELCRAFKILAGILATQAFAFADTSLTVLCRRNVDEAMNCIQFSPEQQTALSAREAELHGLAQQARNNFGKVQRCLVTLRSARL